MNKHITILLCLIFTGCSTIDPAAHNAKVAELRQRTPYLTRIGLTHSMSTIIPAGGVRLVALLPYDRLQSGMVAVYWPISARGPICHFVGGRIGTDSWEAHGMNQRSDLRLFGYLLTRENYIGVIK